MVELVNRESYRRGLRRASALIVLFSGAWALLLVNAILYPANAVSFAAMTLFAILGLHKQLRAVPRAVILQEGSFHVRYALGAMTFGISNIREAVFFKSDGRHWRRPAGGAGVVYLNLWGGGTKRLGGLDDTLADRLMEHLAHEGCDIKVFVQGRRSLELSGSGHQSAT